MRAGTHLSRYFYSGVEESWEDVHQHIEDLNRSGTYTLSTFPIKMYGASGGNRSMYSQLIHR